MKMAAGVKKSFIFILLAACWLIYSPIVCAQNPAIGQVVWVKGELKATTPGEKPRILQRRSNIYAQDQITSSTAGTGEIVFTDGGLMTISPASSLHISEYKYNKAVPANNKSIIDVAKGGFRTITGAISKANPEGYQVNTPVATIGVRGTDYSIIYVPCVQGGGPCGLSLKIITGSISVHNDRGNIILTQGTNKLYAHVGPGGEAPKVTAEPSAFLQTDVAIEPAIMQSTEPAGGTTNSNDSGEPSSSGDSSTNSSSGDSETTGATIDGSSSGGDSGGSSGSSTDQGTSVDTGTSNSTTNTSQPVSSFCIQ